MIPPMGPDRLRRAVQRLVENPLSKGILAGEYAEGDHLEVGLGCRSRPDWCSISREWLWRPSRALPAADHFVPLPGETGRRSPTLRRPVPFLVRNGAVATFNAARFLAWKLRETWQRNSPS